MVSRYILWIFLVVLVEHCQTYKIDKHHHSKDHKKRRSEIACSENRLLKMQILENKNQSDRVQYTEYRIRKQGYGVLGRQAAEFAYPHMAALGWESDGGYQFLCGGTIISDRFVLTAAHCKYANLHKRRGLRRPQPSVVKVGTHDLQQPGHLMKIKRITPHEKYASPKRYYDIALIELRKSLRYDSKVQPACLLAEDVQDWTAVATGWGATESGRMVVQKPSRMLHETVIHSVSPRLCDEALAGRNWQYGTSRHQLCGAGGDTCAGDSGSPLTIEEDSMSYVVGITSFGSRRCGLHPAVYTKVAHFVSWIERVVWPESE